MENTTPNDEISQISRMLIDITYINVIKYFISFHNTALDFQGLLKSGKSVRLAGQERRQQNTRKQLKIQSR